MELLLSNRLTDLTLHQCILSHTGGGKSRALFKQYGSLLQAPGVSTIMCAMTGSELRILDMLPVHNALILDCAPTVGNFRYNPLGISNALISLEEQVDDFLHPFMTLWSGIEMSGELRPVITGMMRDQLNGIPRNMNDLEYAFKNMKQFDVRRRILNRMAGIKTQFFETDQTLDMNLITHNHIIFKMDSLPTAVASFFVNSLMSRLMRYKSVVLAEHFKD